MKKLFDHSQPLLNPIDLVRTFTKKTTEELALPGRAIIVFSIGDLKRILAGKNHKLVDAWTRFKRLYLIEGTDTIIVNSSFGGPNIAALVEELSSFGVSEFIIWGYCGGIGKSVNLGDIIIAEGALREDGVSYHYIEGTDGENTDSFIYTDWLDEWEGQAGDRGFHKGLIWSCDAIYRETEDKVIKYRNMGISAVEMEVASFYAVCRYREVKGIAFLVVSDLLNDKGWTPGFHTAPFSQGVKKMLEFMIEKVIV
ncbi:MAG: nucleoside phosphorylase [Proteobacteria bacterium]|nr:nucleoside phosphorylase [Pseudomonadota bacterium]